MDRERIAKIISLTQFGLLIGFSSFVALAQEDPESAQEDPESRVFECEAIRGYISSAQNLYLGAYMGRFSMEYADEHVESRILESLTRDDVYSLRGLYSAADLLAYGANIKQRVFGDSGATQWFLDQQLVVQRECVDRVQRNSARRPSNSLPAPTNPVHAIFISAGGAGDMEAYVLGPITKTECIGFNDGMQGGLAPGYRSTSNCASKEEVSTELAIRECRLIEQMPSAKYAGAVLYGYRCFPR